MSEKISSQNYQNIYDEQDADHNTIKNLGPLTNMAGTFRSYDGQDAHPVKDGTRERQYFEKYDLQPIDPQSNGPQLYYGLRYHIHITKVDELETFHDQVGYWLWEPDTETVIQTIAIPRGQIAMASGKASADAKEFTLKAELGSNTWGICSNPFLDKNFNTTNFEVTVNIIDGNTWSYNETTTMVMPDRDEPFLHTDTNVMKRISEPTPNPLISGNNLID